MLLKVITLSLLLLEFVAMPWVYGQQLAFPEAQGFGSQTKGGRGGKVIKVTNLNDHGEGSLREALQSEGPRIVVFTVGGIINLEERIVIDNPYVTIAGQTAPGNGICIRGNSLAINTHDVIIRYLRVRPGDIDFGEPNQWDAVDALSIGIYGQKKAYNIIIDHCSLAWSVDEVVGIWHYAHDITIQNSIIAEALNASQHPKGEHGMGVLIGGGATRISMHHNLLAHNEQRNPRLRSNRLEFDFVNNIIYNPGGTVVDIGDSYTKLSFQHINIIGNHFIKGKNTERDREIFVRSVEGRQVPLGLYMKDNIGFYNYGDNWQMVKDPQGRLIDRKLKMNEPFVFPQVDEMEPTEAYSYVLANAGATLPNRDPIDRKIVNDVEERKGGTVNLKDHPLQWPPYAEGFPPQDSDDDGMPDAWEETHGLDLLKKDDAEDLDGDGYTNIEEYLNKTNPGTAIEFGALSSSARTLLQNQYIPEKPFYLNQNYPNPFDDQTMVKFSIPQPANVTLYVMNAQGIKVAKLLNRFLYEGEYEVIWDKGNLKPDMYFLTLRVSNKIKVIKSMLVDN